MPLHSRRKAAEPAERPAPAARAAKPDGAAEPLKPRPGGFVPPGLPRRIAVVIVVRDESGSMKVFRQRQGEYIPALARKLTDAAGPRAADLIYVLYAVISGGVVMTEFTPLSRAVEPGYEPDGETPLGEAFAAVADKWASFFGRVFEEETTVRNCEVLVFSDLHPNGETKEETTAGVSKFVDAVRKFRANVTVVAPDEASVNMDLARQLATPKGGVKFLDSDPEGVLTITFDSLVQASRKVGGSNPAVRRK